ncbi:MAG: hypothetical protein WB626_00230 [Bacteroidota bacterium]
MDGSCCGKPVVRLISMGDARAGIVGWERVREGVRRAHPGGEEELKDLLLGFVRQAGNYVPASREGDYKRALLDAWREDEGAVPRPPA